MRLLKIFTEPKNTFESIKEKNKILLPFIIIVVISIVAPLLNLMDGTLEAGIIEQLQLSGQEVTDQTLQIGKISAFVMVILASVLTPFISAFIYHLVCMFQSKTGYKKTLTVIVYANLILALQTILVTLIYKVTGTAIMFSPLMFMDYNTLSPILSTLLSFINIFTIWYMTIIYIGLRVMHDMTKKEAWITISIPLILRILLALISTSLVANIM